MRLGRTTGIALLVAGTLALPGPAPTQQAFPSGIDLVAVDVTVVDRQGRPATDLRPEDFTVTVGGRPRRVATAQLVRHAATPAPAGQEPPPAVAESPPAVPAREELPGRLIVLAPDLASLSVVGGQAIAQAARRFLSRLTPRDRVALVSLPTGPSLDFTTDHPRVAGALQGLRGTPRRRSGGFFNVSLAEAFALWSPMGDRRVWCAAWEREIRRQGVSGTGPEDCPSAPALEAEARYVYDAARSAAATSEAALLNLLRALGGIEGPKTVVLLSQGLVTGTSGGDPGGNRRLERVADAAAGARATVYTIMADRTFLEAADVEETFVPPTPGLDQQLRADGLEAIAGYTGGPLLRAVTNADFAFERVAVETSAPWLLSFEPEAGDRDGKPHDIRVRVKRDDVIVRARPRFVVKPPGGPPLRPEDNARRALDSPLPAAVIPLTVAAYVLGGEVPGEVRLLVAADVGLERGAAAAAVLGYRLLDEAGAVVAGAIETGRLDPVRSPGGQTLYSLVSLVAKPGSYSLKVAVASPAGGVGSVERPVDGHLRAAGAFLLSDLLVGEAGRRDAGSVLCVDGRLSGRSARAFLEIHARPGAAPPSVQFELAAAGGGSAGFVAGAAVRPSTAAGRFAAEATLDLGSLQAGPYELRAVVLSDGVEAGRVARPLVLP